MRARALVTLVLALLAGAIVRRLDVVEVRGRSMQPGLLPGDRLLVVAARRPPRPGEVVIARDPRDRGRELVKRVASVEGERISLRSDNRLGRTAFVSAEEVRWRPVLRYWPPDRFSRIGASASPLAVLDEGGEPACAFPEALIAGDRPAAVNPARPAPAASPPPSG